MKKFFILYIVLFIFGLGVLLFIKYLFFGGFNSNSIILNPDEYLIRNEKSKEKDKKTELAGDVGKINKNPYANCKVLDHSGYYNLNKTAEVQVYMGSSYLSNVYYYSEDKKNIKFLKDIFERNNEEDYEKDDDDILYQVSFIMNNKTCLLDSLSFNRREIEYIKNNFSKKNIILSEYAKLGVSSTDNPYEYLDYTAEEEKEIIKLLSKIHPLYNDEDGLHGSYTIHDYRDDLLMVHQLENKKEETYAYQITDSLELVKLLNRINKRNINKVLKEDFNLEFIYIAEYKNNVKTDLYLMEPVMEFVREYVKKHPVEEYAEGDYYKIWFLSQSDEMYYINYPINDDIKKLLNSKGVKKSE